MLSSNRWDECESLTGSLKILQGLALRHARKGGHYGRHVIAPLVERGDWRALVDLELPVRDATVFPGYYEYAECRQALAFFQKLEDLEIGVDKEAIAFQKFERSEQDCAKTNTLFRCLASGTVNFRARDIRVLYAARRKIAKILGVAPLIEDLRLHFGPGATTATKKAVACAQMKMSATPSCSRRMIYSGRLPSLLRSIPHWTAQHTTSYFVDDEDYLCAVVDVAESDGRLSFVPKNAKTYRSTVTEPTLCGFMQLGIGSAMEARLKAVGIDITDQSLNQRLAREGSLTGELATLDLSSASDTIARELVKFLLPDDWYALLDCCRSDVVVYKKRVMVLEKFSSMGNGYTFPLETLIFWALTRASCTGTISVYGDDIICPCEGVHDVIKTLTLCGFTINCDKSFWDGPFRESCGHDYYLGIDTRPYYQKELISGSELFKLHNFYGRDLDHEGQCLVLGLIPRTMRLWGPDGYGDGHLVKPGGYHPAFAKEHLRDGWAGHCFETYRFTPVKLPPRFAGDYVSPLYQCYVSAGMSEVHEQGSDRTLYRWPARFDKPDSLNKWTVSTYEAGASYARLSRRWRKPSAVHHAPQESSQEIEKTLNGFPLWGLPGVGGYERVKIYTFG